MSRHMPSLALRLARQPKDLRAAQALRYKVFVEELGATGALTDHSARLEADRFDGFCEHLLLVDPLRGDAVVGVYRLMTEDGAARAGQFASEDEFDIAPLRRSGRRLLELGRSCLHPDYRGGAAMHHLWQGIAGFVAERRVEVLFGLASFRGTDLAPLAQPLSCLHHDHLAPAELRPRSLRPECMDLVPQAALDRRAAVLATPSLIKAYLRLGGRVGEGAYVDRAFNCIDVCLVMDTAALRPQGRAIYLDNRG